MSTVLPPYQRKPTRGLSGKRGLSKPKLLGSQQSRQTSSGSYINQSLLQVSRPSEPQFLAGPSTHTSRESTSSASINSRRGIRGRTTDLQDSLVRKVSVSSMEGSSGHSSGSEMSLLKQPATAARPRLDREISGLGESQASFFYDAGDDYDSSGRMSESATRKPAARAHGTEMNLAPRPQETASRSVSPSTTNKRTSERRTFEDMSLEAQYVDGNPQGEKNYEMEISPGVYLPFRGPQETWRAVDRGFVLDSFCLECGLELVSVPDCQCVVCSECNTVNPVFEHPAGVRPNAVHGVGIGLQKQWVDSRKHY